MEDSSEKIVSQIFLEIFKHGLKSVSSWANWAGDKYRSHDPIGAATKKYTERIRSRYNYIRIYGMAEQVPLLDVYVDTTVVQRTRFNSEEGGQNSGSHVTLRALDLVRLNHYKIGQGLIEKVGGEVNRFVDWASEEDQTSFVLRLEKLCNLTISGEAQYISKLNFISTYHPNFSEISSEIKESAAAKKRILLLGVPGGGKTTLLRRIALDAVTADWETARLPILISLKEYTESGRELRDYFALQFDICNFPSAGDFIERGLQLGKFIILLDGLDEVLDGLLDKAVREIRNLSDKYPACIYLVSCRRGTYQNWLDNFENVDLSPFVPAQGREFVEQWFGPDRASSRRCWSRIKENDRMLDLSSNPLLLTLMCIAFQEAGDMPRSRIGVYREAVDALLKKWDASRLILRSQGSLPLSSKNRYTLYTLIAATTFLRGERIFPRAYVIHEIEKFTKNLVDGGGKSLSIDPDILLATLESHHGILILRSNNNYSFSHLTFQEYFCASHIVSNEANGAVTYLVENYLHDPRWREVVLMVSEMVPNANRLFDQMLARVGRERERSGISSLLKKVQVQADRQFRLNKVFVKVLLLWYLLDNTLLVEAGTEREVGSCASIVKRLLLSLNIVADGHPLVSSSDTVAELVGRSSTSTSLITILEDGSAAVEQIMEGNEIIALPFLFNYFECSLRLIECLSADTYLSRDVRVKTLESLFST